MLKFIFILICFLSFFTICAQQVTNIRVTQEGDKVVITYDISSNQAEQTFDIKVECSADNGKTFSIMPKALSGDLKGITAGTGKRVVWDVLGERETLSGDHFVFQLVATNPFSGNSGTFTDARDGHVYKWVKIGTQVWMAENLKTTKYNDDTVIPNVIDSTKWSNLTTGAYCWYNNETANNNVYGALYNWYAVNTGKLAPKGWHIPTDAEWSTLITFLGGESLAGGKIKELGTTHWSSPNKVCTNQTEFLALPSGVRSWDSTFGTIGGDGYLWSASEENLNTAWGRSLYNIRIEIFRDSFGKACGISVRCVKD